VDYISTYFHHRENSRELLCKLLQLFIEKKQGNYIFFFPSYSYLNMIYCLFADSLPNVDIIAQTPQMSEAERQKFLLRFQNDNSRTLVGFAVLGGVFGEGIDLVGDRLCGAAVVGVGLPGICVERELVRKYYENKEKLGFEYAYQYPGINRVLQAAGRVIRTEKDKGVVLLIDPRFTKPSYAYLLPHHWQPIRIFYPTYLCTKLSGFWQEI
jgi:DNA excision repair protein ERCC-2